MKIGTDVYLGEKKMTRYEDVLSLEYVRQTLERWYVGKGFDEEREVIRLCLYGDYCGSSVDKANYLSLEKWAKEKGLDLETEYGSYSSHWIVLTQTWLDSLSDDQWDELWETLSALEDYPLIDDEEHSMLETDAWWDQLDRWVIEDALKVAGLPTEYVLDGTDEDEWKNALNEVAREHSTYDGYLESAETYAYNWSWLGDLNKEQLKPLRDLCAKDMNKYRYTAK